MTDNLNSNFGAGYLPSLITGAVAASSLEYCLGLNYQAEVPINIFLVTTLGAGAGLAISRCYFKEAALGCILSVSMGAAGAFVTATNSDEHTNDGVSLGLKNEYRVAAHAPDESPEIQPPQNIKIHTAQGPVYASFA